MTYIPVYTIFAVMYLKLHQNLVPFIFRSSQKYLLIYLFEAIILSSVPKTTGVPISP